MPEEKSFRSEKKLKCSAEATAYQKAYFQEVKVRAEKGEKVAYVNADVPMEILRAMDIPFIVNQWWTALSSAKQMNAQYFDLLKENGYRGDICTYCAGALGASMLPDQSTAPWGGLPKISFAITRLTCDCQMKIFDLIAKQYDAKLYTMENTTSQVYDLKWYEKVYDHWDELFEEDRMDAMIADLKGLITFLENETGKMFNINKFTKIMHLINEQEEYCEKTWKLLINAGFMTVSKADLVGAVVIPHWHRGTEWARDYAKAWYEEIKARVDAGERYTNNEKLHLINLGRGLWFNQGFFQHFEDKYGAVFSGLSGLAQGSYMYVRHGVEENPMGALAARFGLMEDMLHTPPFNSAMYISSAISENCDGVLYFVSSNCMLACDGAEFMIREFERAGIPVLAIRLDPINAKAWNQEKMTAVFEEFIENRVIPYNESKKNK